MIVATVFVNIFSEAIIGIFTDNYDIIKLAKSVMSIAIFIELGRAMNMVLIYALRAAGDTVFPVVIGAITMYGLGVFMGYIFIFELGLGIVGVFLASMLDEVIRGLIMVVRWKSKTWTKFRVIPV